jgi:uncharacterized membrane protein
LLLACTNGEHSAKAGRARAQAQTRYRQGWRRREPRSAPALQLSSFHLPPQEIDMLGLTPFGAFHTVISLVALAAGLAALFRYRQISPGEFLGKVYVIGTIATCITGFFIFHHGGFGKPHALGIVTLVVLAIAWVAGTTTTFGRASRYVETIGYSLTVFFHFIPAITETSTRLPAGAPLLASADAPELQLATGALFAIFLVGAALQAWWLHGRIAGAAAPPVVAV